MYRFLRPALFTLDPERAHHAILRLLQLVGSYPPLGFLVRQTFRSPETTPVDLFGLHFPNQVGLAAGYDKDALAWRGLANLGFGHIEIGTVTLNPQPGNQRPRIFRLVEDDALINRLGFPSRGAEFVASRLTGSRPKGLVLGVNLGINKDIPLEQATDDYAELMEIFGPLADYLVINVSSPNTPGLRQLQLRENLDGLLTHLAKKKTKPLLVKLSPDLSDVELEQAIGLIIDNKIDGVIATNTTISRPGLKSSNASQTGGLSGKPLRDLSHRAVKKIHNLSRGRLPIVAVGGIINGDDAKAALGAGASLVQIFTGLTYRGPGLVTEILKA
jgi:dihydroorotate dehydrogenase